MNFLMIYDLLENLKTPEEQNRDYIEEHKARVTEFYVWLQENIPDIFKDIDTALLDQLIETHDASKYSEEEFMPYAQKWFGDKKKTPEYEAAWEHHWQTNPHHPEYWQGRDMEYIYILEMICDWGSFSLKSGDMHELKTFYFDKAKDDEEKMLSDKTKETIEVIIEQIEEFLRRTESQEGLQESIKEKNSNIFKTPFLYHATYQPYWTEIQRDGFLAGGKHSNWINLSKNELVYLARDPEVAYSYCETSEDVPEEYLDQIVVLQVDIDKLDLELLDIDENVAYSYDSPTDPDYPETWEEFQYSGSIPLSAISVYHDLEEAIEPAVKTFLVRFVNSVDQVSETSVKAPNAAVAKKLVKKNLGREVYRIIEVNEIS